MSIFRVFCLSKYVLPVLLILSCSNMDTADQKLVLSAEKQSGLIANKLASKRFSGSYFTISLPQNYIIETRDWYEDFVVFYIKANADDEGSIGGIYLGNHPSSIYNKKESYAKVTAIESVLLGKKAVWDISRSELGDYYAEIITKNRSGDIWNELIHLWITAKSQDDLNNMILYYSTLKPL